METHSGTRALLAALLLIALGAQPAQAQGPMQKAGRGIVNAVTCWIEVPKQVHQGSRAENGVVGMTRGFFQGLGLGLLRLGVGAFEFVTFPFEYPAKFASPYVSMELPDYAWE